RRYWARSLAGWPLIGRAARSLDAPRASTLLRRAARTERIVKGSLPGRPWNALLELTLALAGRPDLSAETA
ncbi:MAG: NAD-dependent deacetylase, partial [Gammaproteobacteria bacterium]